MKASFKMTGTAELLKQMEVVGVDTSTRSAQSATRAGLKVVQSALVQAAPVGDDDTSRTYTVKGGSETRAVDYGHLRDDIRITKRKPLKAYNVVSRVGTRNAFWGRMLEFGTRKMRAHPWFKPALDGSAEAAIQAMVTALGKSLARAVKKRGL